MFALAHDNTCSIDIINSSHKFLLNQAIGPTFPIYNFTYNYPLFSVSAQPPALYFPTDFIVFIVNFGKLTINIFYMDISSQ